jgi:tetratricopeptide (TPR) repeat protein/CHAT domain-containing protein
MAFWNFAGRFSAWGLLFTLSSACLVCPLQSQTAPVPERAALGADPQSVPPDVRHWSDTEESQELFLFKMAHDEELSHDYSSADKSWQDALTLAESTWGPKHPYTAAVLVKYGQYLEDQDKYIPAEAIYRRALEIRETRLDPFDASLATSLDKLAVVLYQEGRFVDAEPFFRRAISIREDRGSPTKELAVSLNNLGSDLNDQTRYVEAESVLRRALAITESTSGPTSTDTAESLENLANNLDAQGRSSEALTLRQQARAIKHSDDDRMPVVSNTPAIIAPSTLLVAKASSIPPDIRPWTAAEESIDTGSAQSATNSLNRGDYLAAERDFRQELLVLEKTWGPNHPVTANVLNSLGNDLNHQGRYGEAEVIHHRALEIRKNRLGPALDTADSYNNLATSVSLQGRYAEADDLIRRAEVLYETLVGADHPLTAGNLSNLGVNLDFQARYQEAEPILRRALVITQSIYGANNPKTAAAYNNIAFNLDAQGRYIEAEPYYRKALEIYQLQSESPDLAAIALDNLAYNMDKQGRYVQAEPLHRKAVESFEAVLGRNHPETAQSINNLAANLDAQGRHDDSEPLLRRAFDINESILGPDHPNTASARENLALSELTLGRYDQALELADGALRSRSQFQARVPYSAPELTQRGAREALGLSALTYVRAAWRESLRSSAEVPELRANAFWHAQLISVSASAIAEAEGGARIAAERIGAGPTVASWRAAQERIATADARLSEAAAQGPAGDPLRAPLVGQRASAVADLAQSEVKLKERFPRFFDLLRPQPLSVDELQKLLRENEALVLLTPGDAGMPAGERSGLVFVVTKTKIAWAEISVSALELRDRVQKLHLLLETAGGDDVPGPLSFDRAAAFSLYISLFGDPAIQSVLKGIDQWLLVPQGSLLSLPFAALVAESPAGGVIGDADPDTLRATSWLGLSKTLSIVPSVSEIRMQRISTGRISKRTQIHFFGLGDPAFTGKPNVSNCDSETRGALKPASTYFRNGVAQQQAIHSLPCLPSTGPEIRDLAELLHAGTGSYVLQLRATEAEVRRRDSTGELQRTEVVAFATHGLLAGNFPTLTEPALAVTPPDLPEGKLPTSNNDGLLTASEVAGLRFSAKLVLLSACDTAAGGTATSDGLSGLARAFFYAGAKSLLVSQFPVVDETAKRLTTIAIRYSKHHKSAAKALRVAMTAVAKDKSGDKEGTTYSHPVQWAPFEIIDAR